MFFKILSRVLFLLLLFSSATYGADTYKIGCPAPMTGPGANFGEKFKKAYTMAAEEINVRGGVNGKKLELVFEDTQAKPAIGVSAAKKLISSDRVIALLGGWSSGVAFAVAPVALDNKTPYLLEHPALDDITRKNNDYAFRLQPTTGMYSAALEDFIMTVVYPKEKKKQLKVAYLYVDNAFGQGVARYGIIPFFTKNKDKFNLVISEAYNENAMDYKPLLLKVKDASPDLVVLTSYLTDGILLAKQSKEVGLKAKMFSGTGAGHSMQDIYEKSGKATEKYFSSGPWHGEIKDPNWKKWRAAWEQKFKYAPGEHEVEGYVAVQVLAEALKGVKSTDVIKQREELKASLKALNMKTIFGTVKFENFDGYTNQNKAYKMTAVAQWINGKLFQVWPKDAAEVAPVY